MPKTVLFYDLGLVDYSTLSSVYEIILSLGMWLFHALFINTEENWWIRKESAFR